jgi:hypothetical protein
MLSSSRCLFSASFLVFCYCYGVVRARDVAMERGMVRRMENAFDA